MQIAATKPARETVVNVARATIYVQGEFGFNYRKLEVRDLKIEIAPYAQYARGVYCTYTPKGARRARCFVQSSHATLVALEGWGHDLEPGGMFGKRVKSADGLTESSESAHTSCSPEWNQGFQSQLAGYLAEKGIKALADFHGHEPGCRF